MININGYIGMRLAGLKDGLYFYQFNNQCLTAPGGIPGVCGAYDGYGVPVVVRKSPFSGKVNAYSFPSVRGIEMLTGFAERTQGALVQDAFPFCDADEREYIMTGITPLEWAEAFVE